MVDNKRCADRRREEILSAFFFSCCLFHIHFLFLVRCYIMHGDDRGAWSQMVLFSEDVERSSEDDRPAPAEDLSLLSSWKKRFTLSLLSSLPSSLLFCFRMNISCIVYQEELIFRLILSLSLSLNGFLFCELVAKNSSGVTSLDSCLQGSFFIFFFEVSVGSIFSRKEKEGKRSHEVPLEHHTPLTSGTQNVSAFLLSASFLLILTQVNNHSPHHLKKIFFNFSSSRDSFCLNTSREAMKSFFSGFSIGWFDSDLK